jgi:hypothetical protein
VDQAIIRQLAVRSGGRGKYFRFQGALRLPSAWLVNLQPSPDHRSSAASRIKDNIMKVTLIAAILGLAVSCNALADDNCTLEPRSKWISMADAKTKVEQRGLTVQRIEADDGCYEVHAANQKGDRIKLTMHPISAAVMEEEIKYAQPVAGAPAAGR